MKALSIRQPWAWLILNGGKDIENRDWSPRNPGLSFRGTFLIHTGRSLYSTRTERQDIRQRVYREFGIVIPDDDALQCGGIVGKADVVNIVSHSKSPWFVGPCGLVLDNVKPLPFRPCLGMLGFFNPT
jgi:hypothetical protein